MTRLGLKLGGGVSIGYVGVPKKQLLKKTVFTPYERNASDFSKLKSFN